MGSPEDFLLHDLRRDSLNVAHFNEVDLQDPASASVREFSRVATLEGV